MTQAFLLCLLTLLASCLGTATGFGTSTIMVPLLVLFVPLPVTLLFVGIIHLCGDIWKIILFRTGFDWRLVMGFGLSGILASFLGASLSLQTSSLPLKQLLGLFLILYTFYLFLKQKWSVPKTTGTVITGGLLSGFFAGLFGVGGAIRGAFLTAFNLPKEVYIMTSGIIALFIDITRVTRYLTGGTALSQNLSYVLLICIPLSFSGAFIAKKFLDKIPQKSFRLFVSIFIGLIGVKLILYP